MKKEKQKKISIWITVALTKRTNKSAANALKHPKSPNCVHQKKREMLGGLEVTQPLKRIEQRLSIPDGDC